MRKMKDSGIEWIGKIPKDWDVIKIGQLFSVRNERNYLNEDKVQLLSLYTGIGVFPQGEHTTASGNHAKTVEGYKIVKKNDIVVNIILAWMGAIGVSNYDGVTSPAYDVYSPDLHKVIPHYFHYVFRTSGIAGECYKYGRGIMMMRWRTYSQEFKQIKVPFPNMEQQRVIADYLDLKCNEIEELIADVQSEIDTLEEYRNSIIAEKVTKGLCPDTEMKDSGIEWVGTIPESWNVHPVYYYFGERKAKNYDLEEQNLLSLSYGKVICKDINKNGGLLPANFSRYNIVENKDIIIRPTDLQNDKRSLRTGLVTEHGIITSAYIALMPKFDVNSKYFHYLLHAYDIMKVFYNMGNGVRQGLNYSEFSKLMLIAPPQKEQREITEYLDNKCAEIDSVIETKKEQIMILDKYKKSIIYEYVTGKKEVV